MKYPTSIVSENSEWGVILRGHDLPAQTVRDAAHEVLGPDCGPLRVTEEYLVWKPRVKWCGNYSSGCDLEGDWHTHWFPVRPTLSPLLRFTVAYPERES